MSVLLSLWLWLELWVPADALLELRGEAEQQVFATGRRDQLDSDRDPVRGLVQGQRDRRLAGRVDQGRENSESVERELILPPKIVLATASSPRRLYA